MDDAVDDGSAVLLLSHQGGAVSFRRTHASRCFSREVVPPPARFDSDQWAWG